MIDDIIQADFIEWSEKNTVTSKNFDLVIGNPPFSRGTKTSSKGNTSSVYTKFFKKSLDLSELVVMIMPQTKLAYNKKAHNDLLRKCSTKIVEIDNKVFSGVLSSMWYVIASSSTTMTAMQPSVENAIEWNDLDNTKNGIRFGRGGIDLNKIDLSDDKIDDSYIEIYLKVDDCMYAPINQVPTKNLMPNNGYVVLMPFTIRPNGWRMTKIVDCSNKTFATGSSVNFAHFDSLEDAKRFDDYMKTPEFIKMANNKAGRMGVIFTKILNSLPIKFNNNQPNAVL